jgi:hypothetical protein
MIDLLATEEKKSDRNGEPRFPMPYSGPQHLMITGDDPGDPQHIVTVHRIGYKFVG